MWFHIQKRKERNKDREEEEETSFVSVLLKTSLSPISKSRLLSGCSLEGGEAHLIFYACSHFPFSLCIPALQPTLLDGDSLSSKEPIQSHVTLADT